MSGLAGAATADQRFTLLARRFRAIAGVILALAVISVAFAGPAAGAPGTGSATTTTGKSSTAAPAPPAASQHGRAPTPPAPSAGTISWGVAPAAKFGANRPHFDYDLAPGASVKDALTVTNHNAKPITLKVYAGDAFSTADGALDLQAADTKPTDVGAWIAVSPRQVTVPANKTVQVPFTLTIPANATPGDHTGGVVTSLVQGVSSNTVNVVHRLGSRVYLRVSGAIKPILTVTDLHAVYHGTANPFGPGGATVTYTVHNSGNIRLAATEQVRVSGLWGAVSATAPPGTLPEILPGDSRTRTVEVADVWPMFHETATVQLTPSAGQDQPTTTIAAVSVDKALWAWPWAALVLIAAVALLVVILIRRRRAGRRKVASAIESAVAQALAEAPMQQQSASPTGTHQGFGTPGDERSVDRDRFGPNDF
jgi:hypothetical protein